jgi:Protein of unknown function (DUF1648)
MIAVGIFTYCAAVAAMLAAVTYFGKRITAQKIPMQWGFNGQPTWYAPKLVGLWTPICLTTIGGPLFLVAIDSPSRAEHAAFGLIVFSLIMAIAYGVHLAAVVRWAPKQSS